MYFRELVAMLQARGTRVYLVSGGFDSLIEPAAEMLNIPKENIFANRIKFYYDGDKYIFFHNNYSSFYRYQSAR